MNKIINLSKKRREKLLEGGRKTPRKIETIFNSKKSTNLTLEFVFYEEILVEYMMAILER